MKINDKSIQFFIELIQEEKVNLPIEHYKDIYTLSEYFYTPAITAELDNISREELFNDLNFTIQVLHDYETVNNEFETKLMIKIEKFLIAHINECIQNAKFGELGISTIFRIIDQSKEKVDHNLLVDFIFESAITRFTILKLVDFNKLREDTFYELISFLDSQEDASKKLYLEYIQFNLSMIKNMMNKYDQVLKELNETKQKMDETKQELNKTKQKMDETNQESNEAKQKMDETNQELNETKQKMDETNQELNETKQELSECKREMKQAKDASNRIKCQKKRCTRSIIVGGYDLHNGLGEKPNNKDKNGNPIISPPVKLSFDLSSLLSYSAYYDHSVLVMSDGSLKGAGYNKHYDRIIANLQKTASAGDDIKDFTDFCIKDGSGRQLAAISAVCCLYGTLYMLSKSSGNERQLVLCDYQIKGGDPVFLDNLY